MSKRSEDTLCKALELADGAVKFYDDAITSCGTSMGGEIFTLLKKDKEEHLGRIQDIYEGLRRGEEWAAVCTLDEEEKDDLDAVFRNLAFGAGAYACPASEREVLDTAVDMEAKLYDFYTAGQKQAEDPVEEAFLTQMQREVRGHQLLLKDMQYYYDDPEGWLMEQDKAGLDGA